MNFVKKCAANSGTTYDISYLVNGVGYEVPICVVGGRIVDYIE